MSHLSVSLSQGRVQSCMQKCMTENCLATLNLVQMIRIGSLQHPVTQLQIILTKLIPTVQ